VKEATWKKGKRVIKGRWTYNPTSDIFAIEVDVKNTITGESQQRFTVHDDTPEWYGWKLQRKE
jgi:hypothetical protein